MLSGKSCLDYEAGIVISKFVSVSSMNDFFAHFHFPCITVVTVWSADVYENGKEKNWVASLTSPYVSRIIDKIRRKKGFRVCLSNG